MALFSIARDKGDFAAALQHARELSMLDPGNPQLRDLVSDLEKKTKFPRWRSAPQRTRARSYSSVCSSPYCDAAQVQG